MRVEAYRLWFLEPGNKRCIIRHDIVFNEADMDFKKNYDGVASQKISEEEERKEEVLVKVERLGNEVHNENQYEVLKEAQDAEENEETVDDYLLAEDKLRRVIQPPQRFGYAYLIIVALISASEILDEEPRDWKEAMSSPNKKEWLKNMDDEIKSLHDNHA